MRGALRWGAWLWILALLAQVGVAEEPPHNVVVLLADDVGVDMIGAYDGFYANHPPPGVDNVTPAIDYLAQTGLLFRNVWTNPVCSPSRAQILTGRHAFRTGIGTVVDRDPPVVDGVGLQSQLVTIPTVLRSPLVPVPYATAAVGKWHLADADQHAPGALAPPHPLGAAVPWFHTYAGAMFNLNFETYNQWTKTYAGPIDPVMDACAPPPGGYCQAVVTRYATVDTAEDAIHLIRTLPEPFFLYVAFNAAHTPLTKPKQTPAQAHCLGGLLQGVTACAFSGGLQPKQDTRCMVTWMDNEIGRIVCAVEDGGAFAPELPTTLFFLGDNGTGVSATAPPFLSQHAKQTLYEGGVHVPFIVKSPLLPDALRGTVCEALVGSTDLFASVVELAHGTLPDDPLRDSVSVVPYLRGRQHSLRTHLYAEAFATNFQPTRQGTPPAGFHLKEHRRAIRDVEGFKLHQTMRVDPVQGLVVEEELYHLPSDPHEQTDLLLAPLNSATAQAAVRLRRLLDAEYPTLVRP